ncbi:hypothetical protein E2320_009022 [Naja naja]|nr:hypothetical protein E2320_009022 [Naja naja]
MNRQTGVKESNLKESKDTGKESSSSEADNSDKSSKEIKAEEISGSPDMKSDRASSERKMELSSPSTSETLTSSTGTLELLDTIADMPQRPLEISVSMQTDASWIHDHIYKRKGKYTETKSVLFLVRLKDDIAPFSAPKEQQEEVSSENDIYDVVPQDLSCLEILCDTEFREDFLKLFQESLQTISSVGPPTILAYRPESSRADIHIEVPKETLETCEFCGSPIKYFPSFESLEHIAEWGNQCRELHEFIVSEKNRYQKKMEMIDVAPHKAHGSQADRERAKERARQRLKERQMAKQIAFMAVEAERSALPIHMPEFQEDKHEKPEIQAVFDSCGKGTCYHPNQIVWINITIRGGHYSDQAGNKVKTWIWPNNLQKHNPRVSFKPIFLSLNLNVGVRIVGQDKIAISFLAMGKQAKINVGTKVQPLAEHLPWPKYVAEEDLLLFANRLKILRIFAKLNRYLDFPASDWWTKLQLPSFLLKQTSKLIHLCKECEISCPLDKLIMAIVKSPV